MYAGAALSAVNAIVALVTRSSLKSGILAKNPGYTSAQLHTAEGARIVPLVIGGVIGIGLWLWMAWANGRGLSWARVVSAVFFGINTLDLLLSIVLVHGVATLIIGIVTWLVGLAAIVLIFNRSPARSTSSSLPSGSGRRAALPVTLSGRRT
jgi:hypothetical protein